jgi:hypothetical protein
MRSSYSAIAVCIVFGVVGGCQSGSSIAGKYRLTGANAAFGEGADKTILELRPDNTFTIDLAPISIAKGTWSVEGETLKLSDAGTFSPSYRIDGGKLIPIKPEGGEVTAWSFSKQ